MINRSTRRASLAGLRQSSAKPKRRPGRPSKVELEAEQDKERRVVARQMLADLGYLEPEEACWARAEYQQLREDLGLGGFPEHLFSGRSLCSLDLDAITADTEPPPC